jgi:uncharacterized protein (TIGR03118 family)
MVRHDLRSRLVALALVAGSMPALVSCGGSNGSDAMAGYAASSLVTDAAGGTYRSTYQDGHLVNAWGLAFNPDGFVWVANAETSTSTLYDGNGVPQSLVVAIPAGAAGAAQPTGIVYSGSNDFQVSQGGVSAASRFIFVGEAGTVAGWAPTVNLTNAVTVYDGSAGGTSYRGAALASVAGANRLYASDFHNGRIDAFDATFTRLALPAGAFTDPALPPGYAPFGLQAIGGQVFIAYAQLDPATGDEVKGAGLGLVSVFDSAGNFVKRLVSNGPLNAPWGMAKAPADFGVFSNALLIANFGDGRINAFDAATGAHLGALSTPAGNPIVIDGLWGIAFGNGINEQPVNTLFFTAGPGDETHGLYGRIDVQ